MAIGYFFFGFFWPTVANVSGYGFASPSPSLPQTRFSTVFQTVVINLQIQDVHGKEQRWFLLSDEITNMEYTL